MYGPTADCLSRVTASSKFLTLRSYLRQFPNLLRLDIHIDLLDFPIRILPPARSEDPTTTTKASPDPTYPIADLVISSTEHLAVVTKVLPLPHLVRLHVSTAFQVRYRSRSTDDENYCALFKDFGTSATVWRSLESVQICLEVTFASAVDHLDIDIWNFWVS
jgi:hypothetical protein